MPRRALTLLAVGAVAAEAYGALQWLGRTYGSTAAERRAAMPGDDVVWQPQVVVTHAITIGAPPRDVWPWLAQMGWHRGGWYTARWVDRLLFPDNRPSADTILDAYQDLRAGDFIPDGAPESACGFSVLDVQPGRHLLLSSRSHLPLSWRMHGVADVHWSWSFVLKPAHGGTATRLVFRWRCYTAPSWLTLGCQALVVPADFIMSRSMLTGIRQRVMTTGRTSGPSDLRKGLFDPSANQPASV
jgi:hypothetical protein